MGNSAAMAVVDCSVTVSGHLSGYVLASADGSEDERNPIARRDQVAPGPAELQHY
jgi:hypothetical protein